MARAVYEYSSGGTDGCCCWTSGDHRLKASKQLTRAMLFVTLDSCVLPVGCTQKKKKHAQHSTNIDLSYTVACSSTHCSSMSIKE
jgi:hypothetical protein